MSWVGAFEMSGNVWEWTATIYSANPAEGRVDWSDTASARVLKGGSWTWINAEATTTARAPFAGSNPRTNYYGFRCARDYVDGDLETFGP